MSRTKYTVRNIDNVTQFATNDLSDAKDFAVHLKDKTGYNYTVEQRKVVFSTENVEREEPAVVEKPKKASPPPMSSSAILG